MLSVESFRKAERRTQAALVDFYQYLSLPRAETQPIAISGSMKVAKATSKTVTRLPSGKIDAYGL
jgi:hypothetical protein